MSEKEALQCKVVFLGESGVGKTSIIYRYILNSFSQGLTSTAGASYTIKCVYIKDNNRSIKFEIWDTSGKTKYRSLAKVFFRNASACILVYDITKRESFEELKNYWIKEIRANSFSSQSNINSFNFIISFLQ